jgi:hypothetical protein
MVTAVLLVLCPASAQPLLAQVNGQYYGQYSGQYRGQFNGRYSGKYYGFGSTDQFANKRVRYDNPFGYPVNTGACGELYFPAPGTDYVLHDRRGRRCY